MNTYVINLAARTDRLERFTWFAQQAGITVTTFPALDGNTLIPPTDYRSSKGAYGCAQSHVALLKTLTDTTLIAEDDCVIPYNANQILDDTVSALPQDWRILLLGVEHIRMPQPLNDQVVIPNRFEHLHAYVVNAGYAPWVAEIADEASFHWDLYFSRATQPLTGIYATAWPWPVYPSDSDIVDSVPLRNRKPS